MCPLSDKIAAVVPKYISVRNAEALTGQGYRWCRDTAHELGVTVVAFGRKRFIPAAEFFAALEKAGAAGKTEPEVEQDPTAEVFKAMGWQVPK